MSDWVGDLEVEEPPLPLQLADDVRTTSRDEDDRPDLLIGEELAGDELDYDPEAELPYPDEDEEPDHGDPGA